MNNHKKRSTNTQSTSQQCSSAVYADRTQYTDTQHIEDNDNTAQALHGQKQLSVASKHTATAVRHKRRPSARSASLTTIAATLHADSLQHQETALAQHRRLSHTADHAAGRTPQDVQQHATQFQRQDQSHTASIPRSRMAPRACSKAVTRTTASAQTAHRSRPAASTNATTAVQHSTTLAACRTSDSYDTDTNRRSDYSKHTT